VRRTFLALLFVACLPQVGAPVDAGLEPDSGSSGSGAAGGGSAGGGTGGGTNGADAGCPGFAGCTAYTDATPPGQPRQIAFPNVANTYAPQCLRIRLGQTVTFSGGNFSDHPLLQACGPAPLLGQSTGTSAQFTPVAAGTYGFYCNVHGSPAGLDMAGALEVIP
jgi:plastocyanin